MKFLNPQSLRENLITASIYLAAWETFKSGVIGHLEGFYMVGFDREGYKCGDDYESRVLARDKSRLRASLLWFQESGVVDDQDLALVKRANDHRNKIAHELPAFVAKAGHDVDIGLLGELCTLLSKIDRWWIRNIEVPTNPDFDDQDVDAIPDSEIHSGIMLFLTMMFNVAAGDESSSNKFYDEFVKMSAKGETKTQYVGPNS